MNKVHWKNVLLQLLWGSLIDLIRDNKYQHLCGCSPLYWKKPLGAAFSTSTVTRRLIWALDDVRITCHMARLLTLLWHSLSDSLVQPLAGHSRRRLLAGTDCLYCICWILCFFFVANTLSACHRRVTALWLVRLLIGHPILGIKNNLAVGYQRGMPVTNQQSVPDWSVVEVKAAPRGIPSMRGNSRTSVGTYCLE